MPARRICSGVTKSGSPTPSEMTSGMVLIMSKNLRIPDGLTLRTRCDRTSRLSVSIDGFTLSFFDSFCRRLQHHCCLFLNYCGSLRKTHLVSISPQAFIQPLMSQCNIKKDTLTMSQRASNQRIEASQFIPHTFKAMIDTDIGDDIDDAFALALALHSPEIDLL